MSKDQGWAWPGNARKAHYFVDGRSLCGRWMFFGAQEQPQAMSLNPGPDDCVSCWRKAEARNG